MTGQTHFDVPRALGQLRQASGHNWEKINEEAFEDSHSVTFVLVMGDVQLKVTRFREWRRSVVDTGWIGRAMIKDHCQPGPNKWTNVGQMVGDDDILVAYDRLSDTVIRLAHTLVASVRGSQYKKMGGGGGDDE